MPCVGGWRIIRNIKSAVPAIERYIKDEAMVHDPEELETGVLFPVCRAEE